MEALTLAVMGVVNVLCFVVGARVGQKVSKDEEIKLPSLNPVEVVKGHREKSKAQAEQERIETIMQNIETYNGTSAGQREVK